MWKVSFIFEYPYVKIQFRIDAVQVFKNWKKE